MENLDLIILSSILVVSFIIFIVVVVKEIIKIDLEKKVYEKESGPRARMINAVGKLFDTESVSKEDKEMIHRVIERTIADMESDGIRFPEDIKKEFEKRREDMICNYSGLPSIKSY